MSVCPHLRVPPSTLNGGTPILPDGGYFHPMSGWGGVPQGTSPSAGWGTPQVRSQYRGTPPPNWNSIVCTCYAAGGMPLVFIQENVLVYRRCHPWVRMEWRLRVMMSEASGATRSSSYYHVSAMLLAWATSGDFLTCVSSMEEVGLVFQLLKHLKSD